MSSLDRWCCVENEYHPQSTYNLGTALRNLYIEKCFRSRLTGESSNVNRRLNFLPDVVQSDSGVYFRSVTTWDYLSDRWYTCLTSQQTCPVPSNLYSKSCMVCILHPNKQRDLHRKSASGKVNSFLSLAVQGPNTSEVILRTRTYLGMRLDVNV